jgi:signal peptidase I
MNRITIILASFGALCVAAFVLAVLGLAVETGGSSQSFRNVSEAMAPTLLAGDYFTVRPVSAGEASALRRGALISHRFPADPRKQFVKRIIALPGDTVAMVHRQVRINGVIAPDPYAWYADTTADPVWDDFQWQAQYVTQPAGKSATPYHPSRDNWGPLVVPASEYFVLGDNRDNSLDSRYWSFVSAGDIVGVPRRVYFSRDPKTSRIRWNRIGYAVQ